MKVSVVELPPRVKDSKLDLLTSETVAKEDTVTKISFLFQLLNPHLVSLTGREQIRPKVSCPPNGIKFYSTAGFIRVHPFNEIRSMNNS